MDKIFFDDIESKVGAGNEGIGDSVERPLKPISTPCKRRSCRSCHRGRPRSWQQHPLRRPRGWCHYGTIRRVAIFRSLVGQNVLYCKSSFAGYALHRRSLPKPGSHPVCRGAFRTAPHCAYCQASFKVGSSVISLPHSPRSCRSRLDKRDSRQIPTGC
jgi:hypothetical protein